MPLMNQSITPTKVQFVQIDADREGQRLDNFLISQLKGLPRSLIYRIVRKGEVRVNKGRIKVDYRLKQGDIVRIPPVRLPETPEQPRAGQKLTELLEHSILFENKGLLIINKPSGLAVHGGSGINLGMIEALRQIRPEDHYLELVHRLDRDTSGCIMVAKKRSMLRHLHKELREGRIQKTYLALVAGQWSRRCLEVNAPLLKNELSSGERIVRVDSDGKPSKTKFKVVQQYEGCSLVEAQPITGRTHQIRVHAQYQGHGLIGDTKYGDDELNKRMKAKGFNRLFLHAVSLSLRLPDDDEVLTVSAPLEESLSCALANLQPLDERG